jgi:uncharacterized protein
MKKLVLALAFLAIGCQEEIPKPVGHVNDFADVLKPDVEKRLEEQLVAYKKETTNEIAVVTVKSLGMESVEDYTVRLAKAWGVGNKKKDNGIVLLFAIKDKKCRIEVGYGLESKLTDIQSKQIIESVIVPLCKVDKIPDGIEKGVDAVILTLSGKPLTGILKAVEEETAIGFWTILVIGIILIVIILAVVSEVVGSGGWSSSGGFSSGGGGGGGFGGGSFGGGGASGGW